jgi:HK97 family phage major capsid protein
MPKLAVPATAEDLQTTLLDKTKLKALLDGEHGEFPEFLTNYVKNFGKANTDVDESIKDQIDHAMANYAREHQIEFAKGAERKPVTAADIRAQAQSASYKSKTFGAGAQLNGKFADLWEFLEVTHPKNIQSGKNQDKLTLIENAMSSVDPASGGFLIPDEFRATLMQVALETAVVRSRATVIPMGSLRTALPFVDSTSNVGSVYGGVIGYWTEEAAALVQSQPNFGRIALEAKKLTAYTEVPNELRRDSAISVEVLINKMFPEAIAWFEDIAFMFGTGVGEPLGIFNSLNSALITQAAESGQQGIAGGGATVLWENIVGMYARMIPSSLARAVWVVSPAVLPQLFTMALSIGTGGSALGPIAGSNGTGAPTMSLLGLPIIVSEKVGNLGGAGDVNLVDFSQYLVGDRMQMEAEVSTEYKFGNDLAAYRFIERVDGRPWLQSAITPRNGGPSLSAFVQLAARP